MFTKLKAFGLYILCTDVNTECVKSFMCSLPKYWIYEPACASAGAKVVLKKNLHAYEGFPMLLEFGLSKNNNCCPYIKWKFIL